MIVGQIPRQFLSESWLKQWEVKIIVRILAFELVTIRHHEIHGPCWWGLWRPWFVFPRPVDVEERQYWGKVFAVRAATSTTDRLFSRMQKEIFAACWST